MRETDAGREGMRGRISMTKELLKTAKNAVERNK